jgi:very-short-patch-repair endonuclease
MDMVHLRKLLAAQFGAISQKYRHADQPEVCERLLVPLTPVTTENPDAPSRSKAERMKASLDGVSDDKLPGVAERLLLHEPPDPAQRNEIQDALWSGMPPRVLRRHRNQVLGELEGASVDWPRAAPGLMPLLYSLFNLRVPGKHHQSFYVSDDLNQWFYKNNDITIAEVLRLVGAEECLDRRFVLLLEGLCSSHVLPSVDDQRAAVAAINNGLKGGELRLDEVGLDDGGYPRFAIVSAQVGVRGPPKNIIFGGERPDLVVADGVNNDIRITKNEDKVLIYDRPIPPTGLRWRDLRDWWADKQQIADEKQASRSLFKKLQVSIKDSPPQQLLLDSFYKTYQGKSADLPALIPEVWLHYDPALRWQRRERELVRLRMDFLMLISHTVRVVIEVDGVQHYSNKGKGARGEGADIASREKYAEMVAEDRRLRLLGYELYRFGGLELQGDGGRQLVADFFEALFQRHPSALQAPSVTAAPPGGASQ